MHTFKSSNKNYRKIIATVMIVIIVFALFVGSCSVPKLQHAEKLQAEQQYLNDSASNPVIGNENQSDKSKPVILIAAAASLEPVMRELEVLYLKKDRPAELSFSFASSGSLQMQIEQGAPVDVFISASVKNMDTLDQKELLRPGSRQDMLRNELVLVAPSGTKIESFDDLATEKAVHIGLGSPESVPAGFYARQVIESLKLEQAISGKEVFAKDVTELVFWVQGGHVDAAMVYMTDAAFRDEIEVIRQAPEGSHDQIIYPAAITAGTEYPAESQDFLDFLNSEAAKLVFEKYGFSECEG